MSSRTNPPFDPSWMGTTHFYKVDAIACLKTSTGTFNALGIVPDRIEENLHCERKKSYIYTTQQVREAARRLGRWRIFMGLGGDPSLVPESEKLAMGVVRQVSGDAREGGIAA